MKIYRRGKKGLFCLRLWIPEHYREIEPRRDLFLSLRTADEATAHRRAVETRDGIFANLDRRLSARLATEGTPEHYDKIRDLAASHGVAYKPNKEIIEGPIEDLVARLLTLKEADPKAESKETTAALLGGVDQPKLMVSTLFDEYEKIAKQETEGKTPDAIRRWRNPRIKAARNFIKAVGDRPILEITRDDALDFRGWWLDRLADPEEAAGSPGTANKDLIHISGMITKLCTFKRWSDPKIFAGLALKEKAGRAIPPFESDWIRDTLLCENPIPELDREALDVLLVMVNTGARPSEIHGLHADDIHLNAPIPFIDINDKNRTLKTEASKRQIPLWGVALEAMRRRPDGFPTYRGRDKWSTDTNRIIRQAGLFPSPDHRAYSLRHSFEDRMTAQEIPERIAADMMGHTIRRERYGKGASLEKKLEVIRRISVTSRI
ncbi:tyrosine-type recombinase/integrase [Roseinatronobacter sp. S2]|uniref:tyrosine-type recombinase/integrase n=1 Tax=Roseinatronobacter sp. S2 TaxID=3035471 RepID=UPI00240EBE49|nr:tyrosine-type recombinase/integrase [Roseinatronobacter sp. S2]WFE75902.1 tyrosine-type recombinase/integrase [Roseinatronobacter sp. S2]